MTPIIAVLLAMAMAIFPISMPRAAAPMGHAHGVIQAGDHHHSHAAQVFASCDHADATPDGSDHQPGSHDAGGPSCCSMGACHAMQVGTVPMLHSPALKTAPVAISRDEQVAGAISRRLDRPPRTV